MPTPISISIALCTCNGERFLAEQLASLATQSYLPVELVVCDDASDDGTCELLESFTTRAPFPVRLYRNPRRLGIGRNFEQAIRLCKGNVIALCDQDDVWLPEKLAHYASCFSLDIEWTCCDARVTNSTLLPLTYTLWDRVAFYKDQRQFAQEGHLFEVLLKHCVVAGATLAFRTELREQMLPIPSQWLYDAWLAVILAANGKPVIVEECLQLYRQHENNAVGGQHRNIVNQLRTALVVDRAVYLDSEINRWQQLLERLSTIGTPSGSMESLEQKRGHLLRRSNFPNNRLLRIPFVFAEVVRGGYSRYSRNWGSVALDLLLK